MSHSHCHVNGIAMPSQQQQEQHDVMLTLQLWFQQHQRRTALLRNALQWRDVVDAFRAQQFATVKAWDQALTESFADLNKTLGELKGQVLSTVDHFSCQDDELTGSNTVDAAIEVLNAKFKGTARGVKSSIAVASGKFHEISRAYQDFDAIAERRDYFMGLLEDFLRQTTEILQRLKELLRRIQGGSECTAELSSIAAAVVSLYNHLNMVCYQGLHDLRRSSRAALANAAAELVALNMEDLCARLDVEDIPHDTHHIAEEVVHVCNIYYSQCQMSVEKPTLYNFQMLDLQLQTLSAQLTTLQEMGARHICAEDVDGIAAMVNAYAATGNA